MYSSFVLKLLLLYLIRCYNYECEQRTKDQISIFCFSKNF